MEGAPVELVKLLDRGSWLPALVVEGRKNGARNTYRFAWWKPTHRVVIKKITRAGSFFAVASAHIKIAVMANMLVCGGKETLEVA